MPTALAISPHLDDAVFSAGGTLARLAAQGWDVVVATVFTGSVSKPTGFALECQLDKGLAADVDYMALRRAEDAAACAIIGAEPVWMPFREAPHRGYGTAAELFTGLHTGDDIVALIAPAIADLVARTGPDRLFAPQAVGAHVDHVAVYQALRLYWAAVSLWVDFPYAKRKAPQETPFVSELVILERQTISLDASEIVAKTRAVLAYDSQLGFQFGGADKVASIISEAGAAEDFVLRP